MATATTPKKKILVTGGTGFLGSYLLRYLLREDVELFALRRPTSPMTLVSDIQDDIRWVEGELGDIHALEQAVRDMDQVYHLAAMVSLDHRDEGRMRRINTEGTAHMVNLALACGVKKFLYVSSVAIYGKPAGPPPIREGEPWQEFEPLTAYGRTKYQAELEVWRGIAEGLNAVIINPSTIIGSGDWDDPSLAFFRMGYGGNRFYPKGTGGFVDVRDVAAFMVRLMDSDVSRERFIVNGENVPYRDLMGSIAETFGKRPPNIPIGKGIQRLYSWWDALQSRLTGAPRIVTSDSVRTAGHHTLYDNRKGRETLEFTYRPIRETIRQTCAIYEKTRDPSFPFQPLPTP